MTHLRLILTVVASSLVLAVTLGTGAGASSGPAPLINPPHNLPMQVNPQWSRDCAADVTGPVCTSHLLATINVEHAQLHEPRIYLPTNWQSLTRDQQVFVVVNLERMSNRYPPYLGLNAALTRGATVAADQNRDVRFPIAGFKAAISVGGPAYGGAWASTDTPLLADYIWMYDDGWGGSSNPTTNLDCHSARSVGCWGHRDSLLGWIPGLHFGVGLTCTTCEVGVGYSSAGSGSLTVAILRPATGIPPMTFTWAHELHYFTHPLPTYWTAPPTTTTTSTTTTTTTSPATTTSTTTTVTSNVP